MGDAYGFRVGQNGGRERRLVSIGCGARVFHYGWCRPPEVMRAKQRNLDRLYHDDADLAKRAAEDAKVAAFYADRGHLEYFRGSHPKPMRPLVLAQDWRFDDGIARQAPAWLRNLEIVFAYPVQKRLARWGRG